MTLLCDVTLAKQWNKMITTSQYSGARRANCRYNLQVRQNPPQENYNLLILIDFLKLASCMLYLFQVRVLLDSCDTI